MLKTVLCLAIGGILVWGIFAVTAQATVPQSSHIQSGDQAGGGSGSSHVGTTGDEPITPAEAARAERAEKISAVHILSLFTALILLFSFWINYTYHEQRTRPIIRFSIPGSHRGLRITPTLENSTNTDAIGLPVIELRVIVNPSAGDEDGAEDNGGRASSEARRAMIVMDAPFSGTQVWYLPAKAKMTKTLSLKPYVDKMLQEIESGGDIEEYSYDVVIKTYVFYKRWSYPTEWWRWAWYGFRHALFMIQFRKIYVSPIRTWVYADYRWKFIPHIEQKEKPVKVDLELLNIA